MPHSCSFFAFRTPLRPLAEFLAWGEGLEAPGALAEDDQRLNEALERDRARLRAYLQAIFSRPEAREALLVASPDLAVAYEAWERQPESERGRGVERALSRYLARMAGRPTPFGLFAGVSVGVVGDGTRLELAGLSEYRRSSRLDLGYLFSMLTALGADPHLQQALTYGPNRSLYPAGRRLRYVESRLDTDELRHELVAVTRTKELETTLARAEQGASFSELEEHLTSAGISHRAAGAYLRQLIENDLLVSELALPVTGPEPLDTVAETLNRQEAARAAASRLNEVRSELAALDESGVGADAARYRAITDRIAELPGDHAGSRLFQVDLFKPAPNATLGKRVCEELLRGVEALRLLAPPARETEIDRFREAFSSRYEGREVPLVEALDPDLGIGFPPARFDDVAGAPLLAGLPFPGEEGRLVRWGAREDLLVRKLAEASRASSNEIVLEPSDLEGLGKGERTPLPDSFAVSASVAAASTESVDGGDFRLLIGAALGPSGAVLLGRFCHGDRELRRHVEEHLRAEEALSPDSVFAEVVHLPNSRMGNLVSRPVLRRFEITTGLGRSGAPLDRQIPVDDLLLSLRDGELVLRSARLGRRVLPRLTTAHNFAQFGIPVYRFLAFLQYEGSSGARWSWEPLGEARFLPRVRLGRLVLSRARWNVTQEEVNRLAQPGAAAFREVQAWRRERNIPRHVALEEGDWILPVDLDNALSLESFAHLVKSRQGASIVELFPGPEELCVTGPEGSFAHELVVPFVRVAPTGRRSRVASRPRPTNRRAPRRFPPGSEWLTATLYLGQVVADEVLLETIAPLAQELLASGVADRWFFVRFADPDWHLRIRFHGNPDRLRTEAQPRLERAAERAWRLRFDTYAREVERYGGNDGVELAERIFSADSDAVLEILAALGGREGEQRWRAGVAGIDALLSDAQIGLEGKEALLAELRRQFHKEFKADVRLREQLGRRYREEREQLEALLDRQSAAPWADAVQRRSTRLAPLFGHLRALEKRERLSSPLAKMMESYVHMHVNRLLRSAHRKQELVLYDFLARLYHSQRVRTGGR